RLGMWAVVSGCGPSSRDVGHRLGMCGDFSGCGPSSRDVRRLLRIWGAAGGSETTSPDPASCRGMDGDFSGCWDHLRVGPAFLLIEPSMRTAAPTHAVTRADTRRPRAPSRP